MITEQQPKLLDRIQDDVKVASDEKTAIIVFVSSEGNMPSCMQVGLLVACISVTSQVTNRVDVHMYVLRNRFTAVYSCRRFDSARPNQEIDHIWYHHHYGA